MSDRRPAKVVARGLLYVPVCYLVVQGVRLAMGNRFEWFGPVQLWIAVVVPALVTIFTLTSRAPRLRRDGDESRRRR